MQNVESNFCMKNKRKKKREQDSKEEPDGRIFREFKKCHQCQRGRQCCTRCVYLYAAAREIGRSSRKRNRGGRERSIEFPVRKKVPISRSSSSKCDAMAHVTVFRIEVKYWMASKHKSTSRVGANYGSLPRGRSSHVRSEA